MKRYSRLDRNEDGSPDIPEFMSSNECGNCGEKAARLTHVPEFNYMGCDECVEEAMRVIAAEVAKPALDEVRRERLSFLLETGCTPEEAAAYAEFVKLPEVA